MPLAAMKALDYLIPIAFIVCVLLAIVAFSYRQTIYAYPSGGGSYIVSRENLGVNPSLVAGASLLTDYILTVSVSVAAGVAAITSAFPGLRHDTVPLCLLLIGVITLANLRGVKESGRTFAVPTYVYIFSLTLLVGIAQGESPRKARLAWKQQFEPHQDHDRDAGRNGDEWIAGNHESIIFFQHAAPGWRRRLNADADET